MKLLTCSLAVLCLSACAGTSYTSQSFNNQKSRIAQISSYQLNDKQIQFQVESAGCTFYSSFAIRKGELENSVEITRVTPDKCGMRKHLVELTYPLGGLGLDFSQDIFVVNSIDTAQQDSVQATGELDGGRLKPENDMLDHGSSPK
ncbi:hypothetical protein FLL45_06240 [Aliikangiella marina]|uniref:Lipoprotein n=2 Tax=Aliikangiella marina TaxID=1712262 RepID=A0A545TBG8_9GAMM|nr:hypothetical protein FLL45_06240 [Aliikangiella marina]